MASQAGVGPLILPILPEILLLVLVIIVLTADLFWRAGRRYLGWLTFAGLALTLVAAMVFSRPAGASSLVFGGMLRHDWPAFSFQVVFLFAAAVTCLLSIGLSDIGDQGEYYALVVVSTLQPI
jgi:NADH:ubiquinone oxidoreductase subunit 2 (subunit N)